MQPFDGTWVRRTMELANADAEFAEKARWLKASVLLQVADQRFSLDTWHGRIVHAQEGAQLTGWDFAICGDLAAWRDLADSTVPLGEATTSVGARLTIDGNQVLAATHWAAVCHLMRLLGRAAR